MGIDATCEYVPFRDISTTNLQVPLSRIGRPGILARVRLRWCTVKSIWKSIVEGIPAGMPPGENICTRHLEFSGISPFSRLHRLTSSRDSGRKTVPPAGAGGRAGTLTCSITSMMLILLVSESIMLRAQRTDHMWTGIVGLTKGQVKDREKRRDLAY